MVWMLVRTGFQGIDFSDTLRFTECGFLLVQHGGGVTFV